MTEHVVTSFGPADEAHGRRMVTTFRRHWPGSVGLTVYVDEPTSLWGVETRYTGDLAGWPETRAQLPSQSDRPDRFKPYGYLWNAQKFAVKPFIWLDMAERIGEGILTWLDGDTVTRQMVPAGLTERLVRDVAVAYMGRGNMHPETGYVGFRLPDALPLLRWCREAYATGVFRRLSTGWTDCHVLRAGLKTLQVPAVDLTSHRHRGSWHSRIDAMALSPLGRYVTHLKGGQRKREALG